MKFVAITFVGFAVFQAQGFLASASAVRELDEDEQACVDKLHLSKIRIQRINSLDTTPEDDDEFNDFLDCSWQRRGLQNLKNGKIDYDGLKEALLDVLAQELAGEPAAVKRLGKQLLEKAIDAKTRIFKEKITDKSL